MLPTIIGDGAAVWRRKDYRHRGTHAAVADNLLLGKDKPITCKLLEKLLTYTIELANIQAVAMGKGLSAASIREDDQQAMDFSAIEPVQLHSFDFDNSLFNYVHDRHSLTKGHCHRRPETFDQEPSCTDVEDKAAIN